MKNSKEQEYTFKEYEVLSFEIEDETFKQFKNLIYDLEKNGVHMDFIWLEDYTFTKNTGKILHIVKNDNIRANWDELFDGCDGSYRSNIVEVDLKNIPDVYFIFAPIILNKMTNIVFDFYEGEDDIHISFFKNKFTGSIDKEFDYNICFNNNYNSEIQCIEADNYETN